MLKMAKNVFLPDKPMYNCISVLICYPRILPTKLTYTLSRNLYTFLYSQKNNISYLLYFRRPKS